MKVEQFIQQVQDQVGAVLKDSAVGLARSVFDKRGLCFAWHAGKDKSEWNNGIALNDPLYFRGSVGLVSGDAMEDQVECKILTSYMLIRSADPLYAFQRLNFKCRSKKGNPEEIVAHLVKCAQKIKDTTLKNIDKLRDDHKALVMRKWVS